MNELALFAGAGGGILGSHLLGWKTVCAVEREPYAREVLLRRQEEGHLPPFPIWDDVRSFDGRPWRGIVDVVSAGFPCQPFSGAGKQLGAIDERNMWPDTIRIIREVGPKVCLLENVPRLLSFDYFRAILGDITSSGFDAVWGIVSASDAGAPHLRKRLWIVAYPAMQRRGKARKHRPEQPAQWAGGGGEEVPDANSKRRPQGRKLRGGESDAARGFEAMADAKMRGRDDAQVARSGSDFGSTGTNGAHEHLPLRRCSISGGDGPWWHTEPELGRVANGVADRVDRLRAIGNGQVPAVVRIAWEVLSKSIGIDIRDSQRELTETRLKMEVGTDVQES